MFRGVHLKLLFKKKQIYGHKAEVFPSFYKLIIEKNFKEKAETTRKAETGEREAPGGTGSRTSCSENPKLRAKGRRSHTARKKSPRAGSFSPFQHFL